MNEIRSVNLDYAHAVQRQSESSMADRRALRYPPLVGTKLDSVPAPRGTGRLGKEFYPTAPQP